MKTVDLTTNSCGDYTHALIKGGLGAIPVLGATAAELFGLIVTPPLEKRKIQWMNELGERLARLEQNKEINIAELANNELFIDAVVQTTTFALRTSHKEKIEAFKNALLNTAVKCPIDETKSQIFLNQLDSFTIWHIRILQFFESPVDWFNNAKKTPPSYYFGTNLSAVIKKAYMELENEDDLIGIIWNDLKVAGFLNYVDLNTIITRELLNKRTSELGDEFLNYIRFEQE